MMKNAFYFMLKTLFFLKIFKFLTWRFWSYWKNDLIRKLRLISKFMTSRPGKQTMTIHILPNISRSKDNQKMNLGQSVECTLRNIFLETSCRKWDRETSCRPLFIFKKSFMWGNNKWSAAALDLDTL